VTMATLSASRIEVSSLCSNDRGGGCVPHPAHRPPRDGRVAGEPAERTAIFRQQVGAELTNASLRSHATDLLEEARAEPESLPAVLPSDVGPGRQDSLSQCIRIYNMLLRADCLPVKRIADSVTP